MGVSAAKVRNLVGAAIKKLGDINRTVTWVHVTPGVYDPTTGATADVIQSFTFSAPVVRADEKEAAAFPAPDRVEVILVPYAELKGLTPTRADYFTVDGARWEILRIKTPPTAAITKIYVETP